MQTQECLRKRHSARSFNSKPIDKNIIEKVAESVRFAPSARNVQPWELVAVTEKSVLAKLGQIAENGRFISECACCIAVFCSDTKYYLEDGCAAAENILISATDLGLASCWVAGDKKPYCEEIKAMLKVPKEFKLVNLIAMGYSDKDSEPPEKKPLKDILHWERY
ncbi:MAG: nitroreductase family protein [Candidatus Omnitrophota bacterium]